MGGLGEVCKLSVTHGDTTTFLPYVDCWMLLVTQTPLETQFPASSECQRDGDGGSHLDGRFSRDMAPDTMGT